jgi:dTDP-glucose 4,6-dehydratase
MSKRVLVTGGLGFIGSCFVRSIMRDMPDVDVYVVDSLNYAGNTGNLPESIWHDQRFFFWKGDIRDKNTVDRLVSKVDAVVHFAAETHVDNSIHNTDDFVDTDMKGTQNLLDAIRRHPVERFIHISTSEVYGTALAAPMTEDHPLNPRSPYAGAKCGADRLVYSYVATFDLPAVILRPFNNYGPHQHIEKVIPCFVTHALQGRPLPMHGNGKSSRDWLFVEDCCAAVARALTVDLKGISGEVINLGTGIDTDVATIGELVLQALGKPSSLLHQVDERPGQVLRHIGSTAKAKDLLGWSAQTNFADGLRRTVQWYVDHENWWRANTHKAGGAWQPHAAAEKQLSTSVRAAIARSFAALMPSAAA